MAYAAHPQIHTPHYFGAPLPKEAGKANPPKEMGKPSAYMGKAPHGNWRTAYQDKNAHPDNIEKGPMSGIDGWKKAGEDIHPAKFDPISSDIKRGEGRYEIESEPKRLDSGENFTEVDLYTTIVSYRGDSNYAGIAASKQAYPSKKAKEEDEEEHSEQGTAAKEDHHAEKKANESPAVEHHAEERKAKEKSGDNRTEDTADALEALVELAMM